jgi:hypothetical protein
MQIKVHNFVKYMTQYRKQDKGKCFYYKHRSSSGVLCIGKLSKAYSQKLFMQLYIFKEKHKEERREVLKESTNKKAKEKLYER